MRQLEQLTGIPLSMSPDATVPAFGGGGEGGGSALSWWLVECHGIWHNLALILPSALFVAYLASQARKSYAKLTYGRSYIMIAYYALLWAVSLLNLLWCVLQVRRDSLLLATLSILGFSRFSPVKNRPLLGATY